MDELKLAVAKLIESHKTHGLKGSFGPSLAAWPAELPRSPELDFYFHGFEPKNVKIDTGMAPIKLIDVANIENTQIGYRWRQTKDGLATIPQWPMSYVVIADDFGGGKPIIAVTDSAKTSVFANYDTGAPFQVADSLAQFFVSISILINVVYGEFEIFEIGDDDGVSAAFVDTLQGRLQPVLGQKNYEKFFDYFYG
jgi:hypothetical protein